MVTLETTGQTSAASNQATQWITPVHTVGSGYWIPHSPLSRQTPLSCMILSSPHTRLYPLVVSHITVLRVVTGYSAMQSTVL